MDDGFFAVKHPFQDNGAGGIPLMMNACPAERVRFVPFQDNGAGGIPLMTVCGGAWTR